MRDISFLIIFIFILTLQKYPIIIAQHEALATLWNIPDDQIMNFIARENQLKDVDNTVRSQVQYVNPDTYAGSYIRTIDNYIDFYITDATPVNIIINLPAVIPIRHLLRFNMSQNNLNAASLFERRGIVINLAFEHVPILIAIFLDTEHNNVVVSLYHANDNVNRAFIDEVNQQINNPPIVFEYKDLPNNEQPNSKASAIKSRIINVDMSAGDGFCDLNQSLTCSLGYDGRRQTETGAWENVFVTSGRCYVFEMDYFLKQQRQLGAPPPGIYRIGKMDFRNGRDQLIDFGILKVEEDEPINPRPFIKNMASPYNRELQIALMHPIENTHVGIHICKSGYNTRVTCGYQRSFSALFFDQIDAYQIAYITNIEYNSQDVGGPAFQFLNLNSVNLVGIFTGGIGNIGLTTNLNEITRLSRVIPVSVRHLR
ncbi:hypothetical protein F8M41_000103 [Gigaspora margarita]|uniref:Uncharacterized protein n=1 Tax=Gigaspora margarita TaxID=4874 RepID=A0A8H4B4V9_GIGMA|nr:hypothetical protein F8M41_000103 [Gigaspora margarita]